MNHVRDAIHCDMAYRMGLTGRGVGVAVLDTGIYLHEDFEHRVVDFVDIVHRRRDAYDDNGHGTHIAGIIGGSGSASDGKYMGIAPECHIIMLKVLDKKGNGYASDVLAGLKWVRDNRERYGIRIVNISVGSFSRKGMTENSVLVRGVNAAWDDGLVVCVAAGNMGPGTNTITTPGISRKVITVGCSDDYKEVNVMGNRMIDYSGRGPTGACICKPEIIAPGAGIMSCSNEEGQYQSKSGTSMSTPLVSGAIALLLQKYPYMNNRDVKLMLRERAVDLGLPINQQGWGLLDVERLLL
ncbi:peptidase S8 [Lacrimispora algidixylanolytica]|uniref:Peptidase S8 n=2 Tax=Lachnospiraceae TaxID=186803 RepID=A0A419T6Q1_9FIRM|nr:MULTISPECIES: S8 family peptidase [Lacrimispora]RKD33105.1 peptidase S8 [Lacrimispora algidixylanolytica]